MNVELHWIHLITGIDHEYFMTAAAEGGRRGGGGGVMFSVSINDGSREMHRIIVNSWTRHFFHSTGHNQKTWRSSTLF